MKTSILLVLATRSLKSSTLIARLVNSNRNLTGRPVHLAGNNSSDGARAGQVEARPETINNVWPRGRKIINDNYCVFCLADKKNCVHVTSKLENLSIKVAGKKDCL